MKAKYKIWSHFILGVFKHYTYDNGWPLLLPNIWGTYFYNLTALNSYHELCLLKVQVPSSQEFLGYEPLQHVLDLYGHFLVSYRECETQPSAVESGKEKSKHSFITNSNLNPFSPVYFEFQKILTW